MEAPIPHARGFGACKYDAHKGLDYTLPRGKYVDLLYLKMHSHTLYPISQP